MPPSEFRGFRPRRVPAPEVARLRKYKHRKALALCGGTGRGVVSVLQFQHAMVRLTVVLHAPAPQALGILDALRTLMRATRLEPGCLECQAWTTQDEDDPCRTEVHYEERWSTERSIERRVRSESFTKVLELLEGSVKPPVVEFDFVSRHQGLEYVEAVRRAAK